MGLEQCRARRVLHVAVAAGKVQLVAGEARSGGGRVGLYGVALIEQTLLVELLQQPPERLDVLVVVSDIGVVEVHEVAHALRQVAPLGGERHHVLAALAVVVLGRDIAGRVGIVDVGLGDAQCLLHAQLHGQAVGVPSGLTLHLEALHGLVAVESVLQRTAQHMVDARVTVGRGRTLVENKLRTALTLFHGAAEHVLTLPLLKNLVVHLCQVQAFVLGKSFRHSIYIYYCIYIIIL